MRIIKNISIAILVLISISSFAQNKNAIKLFDEGVAAFNEKRFKAADSLFTLSAKIEPHKDTYFNLAAVKNEFGDRCGFCENINKSIALGNYDATDLYTKHCIKYDTLYYKNIVEPNAVFYCVKSTYFCSKQETYYVYKEYLNNDPHNTCSFAIDTNQYKIDVFYSSNFEIEKVFKGNPIYIVVQEMPSYLGGDDARIKFIVDNIVYPVQAKKNNIQGTVYVSFVVETDGSLSNVKIIKGIGGGCDEEALRVVRLMPKWKPGKHNGELIRVQFCLPIRFNLN